MHGQGEGLNIVFFKSMILMRVSSGSSVSISSCTVSLNECVCKACRKLLESPNSNEHYWIIFV